ncbi:MAG: AraC family transcriptional regulator [Firmicutes bacterium]|nr:AraC family transcriptional regulator [Bacillota bacterium]
MRPTERVDIWGLNDPYRTEMMKATYVTQSFPRHFHERFAVGVIEAGVLQFYYRGANVAAAAGSINMANPGDPHTGRAGTDAGWTYRMFYLETSLLEEIAAELRGRPYLPFFPRGVVEDRDLAGMIRRHHLALESPGVSPLEQESRVLDMLTQLILRHSAEGTPLPRAGRESEKVRQAREYIEEHYRENLELQQVSGLVNLSPFHLTRVFHQQVGMPLHAYLTQVRVKRARESLGRGRPVTEAALEAGFFDQSHLTRNFKRFYGVTPGQYHKSVQDGLRQRW